LLDTERKSEYNQTGHQLFIDFEQAHDSVRKEVLYDILIEFGNKEIHALEFAIRKVQENKVELKLNGT
jgi:hypothetical protein